MSASRQPAVLQPPITCLPWIGSRPWLDPGANLPPPAPCAHHAHKHDAACPPPPCYCAGCCWSQFRRTQNSTSASQIIFPGHNAQLTPSICPRNWPVSCCQYAAGALVDPAHCSCDCRRAPCAHRLCRYTRILERRMQEEAARSKLPRPHRAWFRSTLTVSCSVTAL